MKLQNYKIKTTGVTPSMRAIKGGPPSVSGRMATSARTWRRGGGDPSDTAFLFLAGFSIFTGVKASPTASPTTATAEADSSRAGPLPAGLLVLAVIGTLVAVAVIGALAVKQWRDRSRVRCCKSGSSTWPWHRSRSAFVLILSFNFVLLLKL